jgi:predicted O-methyltransferase YrrM
VLSQLKRRILQTIDYHVERHLYAEAHDIQRERQRRALQESAELVDRCFTKARSFRSRDELLLFAIGLLDRPLPGLCLEFGVYSGSSINVIASAIDGTIHGFDSFEGLPENWRDGHEAGTFRVASLPEVRKNVVLHKGWFDNTLAPFLEEHRDPVSFVHVDCDLYSSTKVVLDCLAPRLSRGSVLVFDEYFNYPGWQEGEHKAFIEFQQARSLSFEYVAYNSRSEQVAIRLL